MLTRRHRLTLFTPHVSSFRNRNRFPVALREKMPRLCATLRQHAGTMHRQADPVMMKPILRSAVVLATVALAVSPGVITPTNAHARRLAPGPYVLTDLGTLGGLSAQASISTMPARSWAPRPTPPSDPVRFCGSNGSMTDLGTIGGNHSEAPAISDTGHVAGRSQMSTSKYHAILWAGGTTTDLTPSSDYAAANGVNDTSPSRRQHRQLEGVSLAQRRADRCWETSAAGAQTRTTSTTRATSWGRRARCRSTCRTPPSGITAPSSTSAWRPAWKTAALPRSTASDRSSGRRG